MSLSSGEITNTLKNFQRLIGKGNGSLTIHYAGGLPQKIRADMDGEAINHGRQRIFAA